MLLTVAILVALGIGEPAMAISARHAFASRWATYAASLRPAERLDLPVSGSPGGLAPLSSVDAGVVCAPNRNADGLSAVFDAPIGPIVGFDYQRPYRLADDRVLWLVQDAFVATPSGPTLVHNAAIVQSGMCFAPLVGGTATEPASWILADRTSSRRHWFWALGGALDPDAAVLRVLFAEMVETGPAYLTHTLVESVVLVEIGLPDLSILGTRPAPDWSVDGYGFSVASDDEFTYLYSNCYLQFGHGDFGAAPCAGFAKLARVPRGRLDLAPVYWDGTEWSGDPAHAAPVVTSATTGYATNPAQIRFVDGTFQLIEKEGDWWGSHVIVQTAPAPYGPWTTTSTVSAPARCGGCNSYFATWVPWADSAGRPIWVISHNTWSGDLSTMYRPSAHSA